VQTGNPDNLPASMGLYNADEGNIRAIATFRSRCTSHPDLDALDLSDQLEQRSLHLAEPVV
jgi:hypothetical protein